MLAWLALLLLPFENQASEMKYVLSLLLLIPLVSTAQDKEPAGAAPAAVCGTDKYRQFDFWIGEARTRCEREVADESAYF